ncbi:pantoate--beta-alanine ligase [bacterium SCSIO 12643]|nr:pantoate--beta-alanine ligase [bacterium SCSIO 12643]
MLVYRTFGELRQFLDRQVKEGKTIGFVPTMGALHEGHLSLIEECNSRCDVSVCSVFVNPTQFNNVDDLKKYPRTEEEDLQKLKAAHCDVVLVPEVNEVYPEGAKSEGKSTVDLKGLDVVMEGAHRPGHFDGVVQVVSRFFDQINPDFAFFGEKDFQQLAVIKQMVSELKMQIQIVGCPIRRNKLGLALSSRNTRLSAEGIKVATVLYQQLNWAKTHIDTLSVNEIIKSVKQSLKGHSQVELEYFEIVESKTLRSIKTKKKKIRAFIAAHVEGVRLIDNIALIQ